MSEDLQSLKSHVQNKFGDILEACDIVASELTIQVPSSKIHDVCRVLHDADEFLFEILIDLCGVDYLEYEGQSGHPSRYASVYHLLSVDNNQRIRVKTYLDNDSPRVASVVDIWSCADWYERESFDLYGILYEGHPDLRRLLTDYGFIGHPFRKDFPLIGNVEMRYDPEQQRVIYEPVSIEPRVNNPRVVRHDHRYIDPSQDEVIDG
ncbi:MAG: NADH-quinone oxidoreductase subunit C [Gammaproteobacteria bacterium]